jgi:flagellar biosynthesis protein FlhF
MRIKTFTAPTMQDALSLVRAAMGEEAVMLSTYRGGRGRGVSLTAAVEQDKAFPSPAARRGVARADPARAAIAAATVSAALERHGAPDALLARLARAAALLEVDDPELALAGAIDAILPCAPLPLEPGRTLFLVGAPGAGKTVTTAKLAARASLAGTPVRLITCDTVRAGGVQQLEAFAAILKSPIKAAATPDEMAAALRAKTETPVLTLVDTPGANPYSREELDDLKSFAATAAGKAELVLVAAAGGDVEEAAALGRAFAQLGARKLIATRLDIARRYGGLLAAADAGRLGLALAAISPFVAEEPHPLNPLALARLLLAGDAGDRAAGDSR